MLQTLKGIRLRPPTNSDARALTDVFARSWRDAYSGIIPITELSAMIRRRDAAWWKAAASSRTGMLVIEVGGIVAGYGSYGRARASRRNMGEINELYLLPTYQGIGLGEILFEACRSRLDERNYRGLLIWSLADNARAIDFYARRGGKMIGEANERIGGKQLRKIAFKWD